MELVQRHKEVDNMPVLTDILSTISDAEGVKIVDLTPPLQDVIDIDALGQLVHSADESLYVTFAYRQWMVEVQGEEVEISLLPDEE